MTGQWSFHLQIRRDSQFWPHFLSYNHQSWWGQYRVDENWYTSFIFRSDYFLPHFCIWDLSKMATTEVFWLKWGFYVKIWSWKFWLFSHKVGTHEKKISSGVKKACLSIRIKRVMTSPTLVILAQKMVLMWSWPGGVSTQSKGRNAPWPQFWFAPDFFPTVY